MPAKRKHQHNASGRAGRAVENAWKALPHKHRELLYEVGASQWTVRYEPLGAPVHKLLCSAGLSGLSEHERDGLEPALAVWIPALRVVAFNANHPALTGLSDSAYERLIARTAWHEWGHALSIVRCTPEDVAAGTRLLGLAPTGVSNSIRASGYRRYEYTHELVAQIYSLLIARHKQEESERPPWLNHELYDLVKRVTAWTG